MRMILTFVDLLVISVCCESVHIVLTDVACHLQDKSIIMPPTDAVLDKSLFSNVLLKLEQRMRIHVKPVAGPLSIALRSHSVVRPQSVVLKPHSVVRPHCFQG